MTTQQRLHLKCVLLGDANVGKTCLVNRFSCPDHFSPTVATMVASFRYKLCQYKQYTVTLGLWDTAGQTRWDELQSFYCRNAGAAIICYDVTVRASFDNALKWYQKVQDEANAKCVICLVATKVDLVTDGVKAARLKRAVSKREGIKLAKMLNLYYHETSARSGLNVKQCFNMIIKTFLRQESMITNQVTTNSSSSSSSSSSPASSPVIFSDLDARSRQRHQHRDYNDSNNDDECSRQQRRRRDGSGGERLHLLKVEAPMSSETCCSRHCVVQ